MSFKLKTMQALRDALAEDFAKDMRAAKAIDLAITYYIGAGDQAEWQSKAYLMVAEAEFRKIPKPPDAESPDETS